MEKKFLQKETKKLKNLNSHLESRLGEQEQRLNVVTIELNKTWNLVGRMQRQHRQLHTHEQVLRYQLQQKRRMLNELKEELEYCRRKWALAKEKNNESQSQWESLRLEFSQRKENDLNNSGESGYSDSPVSEEEDEDDSSASLDKPRNSRLKKKINLEQFLLTVDQKDRKAARIHSVSPIRNAREVLARCNSESQLTQFATEVFQASIDVVEPIEITICAECGENCVKHSVHFDVDSVAKQQATDQVKVSEPIVRNPIPKMTNAQKLVEAKTATSKAKMCCEARKSNTITKPKTSKTEESLEEMFLRLSGEDATSADNQNTDMEEQCDDSRETSVESTQLSEQEAREARRIARIERLEGQCKLLMTQVIRASNRGDELNKRADEAHTRFGPDCDQSSSQSCCESREPQPSTSGLQNIEMHSKTDEECLTPTEREYLARRDQRLKRLEAESQAYVNRLKSMSLRASSVDTKLSTSRSSDSNEPKTQENKNIDDHPSNSAERNTKDINSASTSSTKTDDECLTPTEQEYLARRDERLKRLEAESQAHLNRMKSMKHRAASVDTKLDAIRGRVENLPHSSKIGSDCVDNAQPSTSNAQTTNESPKTDDECLTPSERDYLSRRAERLERLESETQTYMNCVKSTNRRATDVDTKLEFLHGRYGNETEVAENNVNETATSTELAEQSSNQEEHNESDQSSENPPNVNENNENTSN